MINTKNETLSRFPELMDALLEMHKEVVVKKNMNYQYSGPDLSNNSIRCTSPEFSSTLSPEGLDWEIKEKCKKPIEVILTIALQMGIQHGIDLASNDPLSYLEVKDWNRFEKMAKMAKKFS